MIFASITHVCRIPLTMYDSKHEYENQICKTMPHSKKWGQFIKQLLYSHIIMTIENWCTCPYLIHLTALTNLDHLTHRVNVSL